MQISHPVPLGSQTQTKISQVNLARPLPGDSSGRRASQQLFWPTNAAITNDPLPSTRISRATRPRISNTPKALDKLLAQWQQTLGATTANRNLLPPSTGWQGTASHQAAGPIRLPPCCLKEAARIETRIRGTKRAQARRAGWQETASQQAVHATTGGQQQSNGGNYSSTAPSSRGPVQSFFCGNCHTTEGAAEPRRPDPKSEDGSQSLIRSSTRQNLQLSVTLSVMELHDAPFSWCRGVHFETSF